VSSRRCAPRSTTENRHPPVVERAKRDETPQLRVTTFRLVAALLAQRPRTATLRSLSERSETKRPHPGSPRFDSSLRSSLNDQQGASREPSGAMASSDAPASGLAGADRRTAGDRATDEAIAQRTDPTPRTGRPRFDSSL